MGKTIVSITLSRRAPASLFSRSICSRKIPMAELVELKKEKDGTPSPSIEFSLSDLGLLASQEISLALLEPGTVTRHLAIKLGLSDVKENATVALANLLALTDDDDEIRRGSNFQAADQNFERVVRQGKALMQNRLSENKSFRKALPQVDSFVDVVDNIVQVSRFNETDRQ